MKDVLCPNCQKDEYQIVRINGVKVKQCRVCGAYYQLAEKEIVTGYVLKYLHDCKDAKGNFVRCPRCGRPDIKKISEISTYEFFMFETRYYFLETARYRSGMLPDDIEEYYLCQNPRCRYWWKDLDCQNELF